MQPAQLGTALLGACQAGGPGGPRLALWAIVVTAAKRSAPARRPAAKPAPAAKKPAPKPAPAAKPAPKPAPAAKPRTTTAPDTFQRGPANGAKPPVRANPANPPAPAATAPATHVAPAAATGAIPADLQTRIDRLRGDTGAFAARADAYLTTQDQIAAMNFRTLEGMGDVASRNPDNPFGFGGHLPHSEELKLRAMSMETTRQLRQDLREGRTSAILDPGDFANVTTGAEARSVMRVNQALQDNDIPRNFRDLSPATIGEVRSLQELNEGRIQDHGGAAVDDAMLRRLDGMSERERDREIERMVRSGELPRGHGLEHAIPNAADVPAALRGFRDERDAINAALRAQGRDPMSFDALDGALGRMQRLDDAIADYGRGLHTRYGGQQWDAERTPFHHTEVLDRGGMGNLRTVPIVDATSGQPLGNTFMPRYGHNPTALDFEAGRTQRRDEADREAVRNSSLGGTLNRPLTEPQLDELVRVNDSLNLLRGNQSGLSLRDVPMSAGLKDALGIPQHIGGQVPTAADRRYQPFDLFPKPDPRTTMEAIDRTALLPRDERAKQLDRLSGNTFREALGARSHTELNAEFENTPLNRISEAIDPFSYVFQQQKTDWIGPRAQIRTEQAANIEKKVSELTHGANMDVIAGRYGSAMEKLRGTMRPLDYHHQINADYDRRMQDTELRTGLTIATAPLMAIPAVEGMEALIGGGRRMLAGAGARAARAGVELGQLGRGAPAALVRQELAETAAARLGATRAGATTMVDDLAHTRTLAGDAFRGRPVSVQRSSGAIEKDWRIAGLDPSGNVIVEKPGVGRKIYPPEQLVNENPGLIRDGQQVRVRRTSGAIENDWNVVARNGEFVRVARQGAIKDVHVGDIMRLNFGDEAAQRALPAVRGAQVDGAARYQSQGFRNANRIEFGDRIRDGFADGGRGMHIDAHGQVNGGGREVLVVDRARDAQLQKHIEYARSLQNLPPEQRARELAKYVDNVFNPPEGRGAVLDRLPQLTGPYQNAEVLIGDVPAICEGGVCRHRSLMYKVLGDEAGLDVALVRGNYGWGENVGGHAWNELRLGKNNYVVDVMNPPPAWKFPAANEAGPLYLDMGNTPMYATQW